MNVWVITVTEHVGIEQESEQMVEIYAEKPPTDVVERHVNKFLTKGKVMGRLRSSSCLGDVYPLLGVEAHPNDRVDVYVWSVK